MNDVFELSVPCNLSILTLYHVPPNPGHLINMYEELSLFSKTLFLILWFVDYVTYIKGKIVAFIFWPLCFKETPITKVITCM